MKCVTETSRLFNLEGEEEENNVGFQLNGNEGGVTVHPLTVLLFKKFTNLFHSLPVHSVITKPPHICCGSIASRLSADENDHDH